MATQLVTDRYMYVVVRRRVQIITCFSSSSLLVLAYSVTDDKAIHSQWAKS